MMQENYLPQNRRATGVSLWMASLIVLTMLLLPSNASTGFAQNIHPACLNDAGVAVIPRAGAGVGGWLFILNFNHSLSASNTLGCLVETTGTNPQTVKRTLHQCAIINNADGIQVGSGVSSFDGKFSIQCAGFTKGKQKLKTFSIWGRAEFMNKNVSYSILQHTDVEFIAALNNSWHVNFTSRYGSDIFSSGHPNADLMGKEVEFMSELRGGDGSHWLDRVQLNPITKVNSFDYHNSQPITIGAGGSVWTLSELIIDPPGGCCKGS